MNAIVFATEQEARYFLKNYERGRFDGLNEGDVAHDDTLIVTITGIGKIKAALRTERMLREHRVRRLLHVGTCTALAESFSPGELVASDQVFEGDRIELSAPTYPRMPLEIMDASLKTATLVTQDHTPQDEKERTYWQRIAQISDMSGYAIAYVAALHGAPCHIVKVVTGYLFGDDANFQRTLERSHEAIGQYALRRLPA
ncbi:MAG: 5'-methylthioadenosine nucleosidase [Rhodothermales bacterium]